jgi:hypothetical protein
MIKNTGNNKENNSSSSVVNNESKMKSIPGADNVLKVLQKKNPEVKEIILRTKILVALFDSITDKVMQEFNVKKTFKYGINRKYIEIKDISYDENSNKISAEIHRLYNNMNITDPLQEYKDAKKDLNNIYPDKKYNSEFLLDKQENIFQLGWLFVSIIDENHYFNSILTGDRKITSSDYFNTNKNAEFQRDYTSIKMKEAIGDSHKEEENNIKKRFGDSNQINMMIKFRKIIERVNEICAASKKYAYVNIFDQDANKRNITAKPENNFNFDDLFEGGRRRKKKCRTKRTSLKGARNRTTKRRKIR